MITKPQLPPRAGYVEVVDSDGHHVYKKIETENEDVFKVMADVIKEGVNNI